MLREQIMFRFVPTMRCNFRCEYCFEDNESKKMGDTMFDEHSVQEWVDAMKQYNEYDVELYFWGGEPFCIDGTYQLLKEWTKMDHVISGIRIDTNLFYADRIAEQCPTDKIKLNCSYHMQYHSLEEEFRKVKLLKQLNMIGMVNFVASKYNLQHLKNEYGMTVQNLIQKFSEMGVFLNVAGDFAYTNNVNYERYEEYREFILQFISPDEWKWLRGGYPNERYCTAGQKMFTVERNGNFSNCTSGRSYGNFFGGYLNPDEQPCKCSENCLSLVSYPYRCDNEFKAVNSLLEYVNRNQNYRDSTQTAFVDFVF